MVELFPKRVVLFLQSGYSGGGRLGEWFSFESLALQN